jgi:hypothetical protein
MFVGSSFIVQIILREKRGNFHHFLNKSTVSVYEHKIAKSVDYNLQVKNSKIWNWPKISELTNWKFYVDAE